MISEFTPIKRMDDRSERLPIAGIYHALYRRTARHALETDGTASQEILELRKQGDALRQHAEAAAAASPTAGTLKRRGFNAVGA